MQAKLNNTISGTKRFFGSGVYLSRSLLARVPLHEIMTALNTHETAARNAFEANSRDAHYESEHTSHNGVKFLVTSDQSQLLVSAYLDGETSGLSQESELPPKAA
jgi:hypothetical protein